MGRSSQKNKTSSCACQGMAMHGKREDDLAHAMFLCAWRWVGERGGGNRVWLCQTWATLMGCGGKGEGEGGAGFSQGYARHGPQ